MTVAPTTIKLPSLKSGVTYLVINTSDKPVIADGVEGVFEPGETFTGPTINRVSGEGRTPRQVRKHRQRKDRALVMLRAAVINLLHADAGDSLVDKEPRRSFITGHGDRPNVESFAEFIEVRIDKTGTVRAFWRVTITQGDKTLHENIVTLKDDDIVAAYKGIGGYVHDRMIELRHHAIG